MLGTLDLGDLDLAAVLAVPVLAERQGGVRHGAVARALLALEAVLARVLGLEGDAALALVVGYLAIGIEAQTRDRVGRVVLLEKVRGLGLEVDAVDGEDLVDRRRLHHFLGRAENIVVLFSDE